MKRRRTFNNVMFWVSMIWGLSMVRHNDREGLSSTANNKADKCFVCLVVATKAIVFSGRVGLNVSATLE